MARRAGVASSRWAAAVQIEMTGPYWGFSEPSMMPGCSRNWRLTSWTTVPAERPTARMASEEKRKAIEPPMRSPMKVVGLDTLIWVSGELKRLLPTSRRCSWLPIVSMNEEKGATAAITAEPMAKPLVMALVVLPTASRLTITRSASPWNSPLISAIPAALSEMGPKVSSETTIPAFESRPRPTSETRYSSYWMLLLPRAMATTMATTMAMM